MPTPTSGHTPRSRRSFRPQLTQLEDRSTPTAITTAGTAATIDLNGFSGGEAVTITTTVAGDITVASNQGVTLNGGLSAPSQTFSGATTVQVTDSTFNNALTFGASTVAYAATFAVVLDNSPTVTTFNGLSDFGANALSVTTTSNTVVNTAATVRATIGNITFSANAAGTTIGALIGIDVQGAVTSTSGAVSLSGRGGTDSGGSQVGIQVSGGGTVSSAASGSVTLTGTGGASLGQSNYGVFVTLSSTISSTGNGSVVVTGTGGGTGSSLDNVGVLVSADADIIAGGVGSVVVTGSGGAGTGGGHVGVSVTGSGSRIASGGSVNVTGSGGSSGAGNVGVAVDASGAITSGSSLNVTGSGGGGALGLTVATGGTVASGGTAALTLTADSIDLDATAVVRAGASGTATATLQPVTTGTPIDLGGADLFGTVPVLGLTDAELDRVSAGTLVLGRTTAGALTVSAPLTRPTATDVQLISGAGIAFTGGGVDTGGGTLNIAPNNGFTPTVAGQDATATTTSFTAGSALNIAVAGTTVDTLLTQLNASGAVALTGVSLALSGGYVPVFGDSFTIVSASSVTGTFTGLPNGSSVTFNGVDLRVFYTPTAVTLRTNRAPTNVSAGGPYTIAEGSGLTVSAPAATDPDGDALTYTWDVNGDGLFGDEVFGTVTDGGRTVTFTPAQMAVLGLADGLRTVTTLAVRVSDGFPNGTVTAAGTLTISNVTPTISSFVVPSTATVGQAVASSATATDPAGANDPLAFAWVVTLGGATVATGSGTTFTFTPAAAGTYTVAVTVSDGDGGSASASANVLVSAVVVPPPPVPPVFPTPPLVFSNAGRVRVVYPDGTTRDLEPFPGYLGDVTVASADMNGDGVPEVVVGAGPGGGPHVVVFDGATGAVTASFFAYDVRFTGGVYVAATSDGRIITGAGAFGGPHVKVIAYARTGQKLANGQIADTALVTTFFAYDVAFNGGVRVAAADVTGDGVADIVTGAGPGGGPHVKVFDGVTAAEVRSFFAFAPDFAGGVYVAAATGYLAAGAGTWGGPHVKAFNAAGRELLNTFAYNADFIGGVRVAFADVDPDGTPEVITAPGLGGGQPVRAFRLSDLTTVLSVAPFDPLDPLGIFVG